MRLYKADGGVEDAGAKGAGMKANGADDISIDSSEMASHGESREIRWHQVTF